MVLARQEQEDKNVVIKDLWKQLDSDITKLQDNGMLDKRTSRQWYDPKVERFLPDRFVRGRCPNPKCDNEEAFSDECDRCGQQYELGLALTNGVRRKSLTI